MTWTRAASEPELGPSGGSGRGPHPLLGSAPVEGSRRLGLCARLLGSSGKADLGQEEAQMTHCPTSSKVKTQQCVWPLGLDVTAALAASAAKIKAVGQQPSAA